MTEEELTPLLRPAVLPALRSLTRAAFAELADVPPELEWLANITNPKTRRAYKVDVAEFMVFTGLADHTQLRSVTRAHVIAWRKDMESRSLAAASVRRKLSALSSLFDYLCERNAALAARATSSIPLPASEVTNDSHERNGRRSNQGTECPSILK